MFPCAVRTTKIHPEPRGPYRADSPPDKPVKFLLTNIPSGYIVHFMNYIPESQLNEELLSAWLHLTSVIDNQRLAAAHTDPQGRPPLPFNEAVVCGLLAQARTENRRLSASDLCRQTRILKSQMNAILRSLERKGMLSRRQSHTDRRRVELELLPEGVLLYQEGHRRIRALVDRLIGEMGREQVETLIPLLRQAASIFDTIQ